MLSDRFHWYTHIDMATFGWGFRTQWSCLAGGSRFRRGGFLKTFRCGIIWEGKLVMIYCITIAVSICITVWWIIIGNEWLWGVEHAPNRLPGWVCMRQREIGLRFQNQQRSALSQSQLSLVMDVTKRHHYRRVWQRILGHQSILTPSAMVAWLALK